MTEPRSMKDWQVEESSDPENQWQLLETEQELPSELTLEETAAPPQDWQPVEYAEPERSGSRNWILPSFIILAMIAVVAYIAWLGLNGDGIFPPASIAVENTPESVDPAAIVMEETATEVPTATAEIEPTATAIPTPVPSPTPELVEQRYATIDSLYGLNARSSPDLDAEVVAILDDGQKFVVSQEQNGRLELILEDGSKVWVSSEFVIESFEFVAPDVAVGLPVEPAEVPPADAPADETLEAEPVVEDQPTETTGFTPPEPFTDLVPSGAALLVLVDGGVNARTADSVDSDIILTIPQGAALSALGQNAAGDWLRTELPNGTVAWVFKDTVETRGAVDSLLVVDAIGEVIEPQAVETPIAEEETTADVSETGTLSSTLTTAEPITTTETVDAAPDVDPEITVGLIGVKARTQPELGADVAEVLSSGTVLPATGRSADSTWVSITLDNEDVAWVLAGAVDLSVAPATLPVVEP